MVANVHELPVQPDEETMAGVLHTIFAASMHGRVEIAWIGNNDAIGARQFDLTEIDEAAAFAARANVIAGHNVYFSAGLRSYEMDTNKRGKKDDVIAVAALKLDCDDPGCLTGALNAATDAGFPPTLALFTGREPSLRGSLWWTLEEPDTDKLRAERLEQRLIAAFGADKSGWNCDRIMRLAGSVAWPTKKGRVLEITGRYEAVTRKAPYILDEIEHALNRMARAPPKIGDAIAALDLNESAGVRRQIDVPTLLAAARDPGQFHENALPAVMSLVRRGVPPEAVVEMLSGAIAMAGVNVEQRQRELIRMVRGAVQRVAKDAAQAPVEAPPLFLTATALLNLPPVEWMVEGYLPTQGMSALFAPPGAFKSFLALDLGLSVTYGLPWHGFATRQRKTLYVLAEGKHGFGQRARVWQEQRAGGLGETDQFMVLPTAVNMLNPTVVDRLIAAIREHIGEVGFIILDTLARNFGPGDENSTKDMNAYVLGAARLTEAFGAHLMHVHHTGKDEGKGERGSSAFLGALDTSLKLVRDGAADAATLYVKKQKDGPEARPMRLSFPLAEGSHPSTGEVFHSRIPTLAGEPDEPLERAGAGFSKAQSRMLQLISTGMSSPSLLASALKTDRHNVRRSLLRLQERGLVQQDRDGFWIVGVRHNNPLDQDDE